MSWISAQIKIKMCLTKCWEQIFDFAKFFGFLGLQRSKNEILPQFSPYLTPKIWKFSQNQKSVPNILWDTFRSWLEPKFTTFGQFARDLLTFLRFSRLKFGDAKWLCPRWRAIKAIGGGPRSKFCFCMFLVANLVYFHLLFTEFQNFDPSPQNCRICRGGWRVQGVILGSLARCDDQIVIKEQEYVLWWALNDWIWYKKCSRGWKQGILSPTYEQGLPNHHSPG